MVVRLQIQKCELWYMSFCFCFQLTTPPSSFQLFSSFYIYEIAQKLDGAEQMLKAMGYRPPPANDQSQELRIEGEVNLDHVARTAADLVILQYDLELLKGNAKLIARDHSELRVRIADILVARGFPDQTYTDTYEKAISLASRRNKPERLFEGVRHILPRASEEGVIKYPPGTMTNANDSERCKSFGIEPHVSEHLRRRSSEPILDFNHQGINLSTPRKRSREGSPLELDERQTSLPKTAEKQDTPEKCREENAPSSLESSFSIPNTNIPRPNPDDLPDPVFGDEGCFSARQASLSRIASIPEENISDHRNADKPANIPYHQGKASENRDITGTRQEVRESWENTPSSLESSFSMSYSQSNFPQPNPNDLPDPVFDDEVVFVARPPPPLRHVSSGGMSCDDNRVGLYVNPSSAYDEPFSPDECHSQCLPPRCGTDKVDEMLAEGSEARTRAFAGDRKMNIEPAYVPTSSGAALGVSNSELMPKNSIESAAKVNPSSLIGRSGPLTTSSTADGRERGVASETGTPSDHESAVSRERSSHISEKSRDEYAQNTSSEEKPPDWWVCAYCTFINSSGDTTCEVCGILRKLS